MHTVYPLIFFTVMLQFSQFLENPAFASFRCGDGFSPSPIPSPPAAFLAASDFLGLWALLFYFLLSKNKPKIRQSSFWGKALSRGYGFTNREQPHSPSCKCQEAIWPILNGRFNTIRGHWVIAFDADLHIFDYILNSRYIWYKVACWCRNVLKIPMQ